MVCNYNHDYFGWKTPVGVYSKEKKLNLSVLDLIKEYGSFKRLIISHFIWHDYDGSWSTRIMHNPKTKLNFQQGGNNSLKPTVK